VEECDGSALVSVADNGKGLGSVPEPLDSSGYGMGMVSMKHRVEEYGGQLFLRDTGTGTLVEARIPLRNSQAKSASALLSNWPFDRRGRNAAGY
jgi:signal transduction histidine kinase